MKAVASLAIVVATTTRWTSGEAPRRVELDLRPHGTVVWTRGGTPGLVVRPRRGDGWISLAKRYSGTRDTVARLRRANPGLAQPMRDRGVRIPLETLRADLRLLTVQRLFSADRRTASGWEHWVLDPFGGEEESWRWLAALFCDRGDLAGVLQRANPEQPAASPRRARVVLIPESRLLTVFRRLQPVATPTPSPTATPPATPVPTVTPCTSPPGPAATPFTAARNGDLDFGADEVGGYAVYRLRRGEALYSAVVVRFTGQLHAKQVNATAFEIAERSGIADVTDIPIGYPIKIPLELLLPEHLPSGHPRRSAWEAERRELAGFFEVVHATDLSGVHVILDAGHGGTDSGAVVADTWEATYAYDIACRIRRNLERHTRATVWMTRKDESSGFDVTETDRLTQDRDQFLLTHPRYALEDSTTGVHLRWYLTNHIVTQKAGADVPRSNTVFLSVHADSLHSSVRGAMVYVPSRYLRPDSYTVRDRGLKKYDEVRSNPTVRLSTRFKARAEASSRHLAGRIIAGLGRNELAVHPYEPVRDRVLRGRRKWVPAVLRYSLAQHAVLVECCNMGNAEDREQLLDHQWRERFARAIVEGTAAAFGGADGS